MTSSVWRKRLKVIGLLLCLMMPALWVFSVMYMSTYVPPSGQWRVVTLFGHVLIEDGQVYDPGRSCRRADPLWKAKAARKMPWTEFANTFLGFRLPKKTSSVLQIPVWLLLVAVGFPTAILWWRDRRPKAGFCKVCKYDLTGNVSGTCPECGTAVGRASKTHDATTPTASP